MSRSHSDATHMPSALREPDWNEKTLNPNVILGYFDKAPNLRGVEIRHVSLLSDGPMAEIVLDVGEFPERPSSKWPAGANTCQITIRAIGISEVEIDRWGSEVVGNLDIKSTQGKTEILFAGEGRFRLLCSHIDVVKVSGYLSKRP